MNWKRLLMQNFWLDKKGGGGFLDLQLSITSSRSKRNEAAAEHLVFSITSSHVTVVR